MRLLEVLAAAFINTFGITQPTEKTRRRAAWFILALLIATAVIVVLVGLTFLGVLHA